MPFPVEGEEPPPAAPRRPDVRAPAPPAASDEFLDRATGRDGDDVP
jgi:hypothetical protein